jgi:hypothetical protein
MVGLGDRCAHGIDPFEGILAQEQGISPGKRPVFCTHKVRDRHRPIIGGIDGACTQIPITTSFLPPARLASRRRALKRGGAPQDRRFIVSATD